MGGARDAVVESGCRASDHDDLDGSGQGAINGFEKLHELCSEERLHEDRANFSNMALKLSRPMFMT